MSAPILIFGATGGIGSALARRLATEGHALHLSARSEPPLAALATELGCDFTPGDVTAEADILRVVERAAGPEGRLRGLAYAVGTMALKPLAATTGQDLADALRRDVIGAFLAAKAARKALAAANGAVVLFSSVAARRGFASHTAIGTAKAAVEGLTLALAADLAPDVRVNAVAPSLTRTPLAAPILGSEAMAKAIAARHALKRLGEPDDGAAMAAFLLSEQAAWITGQIIAVDGGRASVEARG